MYLMIQIGQCKRCGWDTPQVFLDSAGGFCEGCELMTVAEACARLGFQTRTLQRWIRRGVFRKVKLGQKAIRLYRHEVEKIARPNG